MLSSVMDITDMSFRLGYRPALDGLRAIAILLVMGFHIRLPVVTGGFLGVDVFFVLSGFLITTLLVQEVHHRTTIDLRRFYLRRAFRLLPAVLLLLTVLVALCAWFNPESLPSILYASGMMLAYIANIASTVDPFALRILTHTWSLSLEEQFYIVFPFVVGLFVTYRVSWQRLRWLLLAAIVAVNASRIVLMLSGASWYRIYYGVDTRADGLLWGCWLALTLTTTTQWQRPAYRVWTGRALIPVLLGVGWICTVADSKNTLHFAVLFPLVTMSSTLIVFHLVTAPRGWLHSVLESRLLVGIGKISYGLYLWNFPVYYMMLLIDMASRDLLLYGTPLIVGISLASYYLVEQPFLRLSNRLTSSTSNTLRSAPSLSRWQVKTSET